MYMYIYIYIYIFTSKLLLKKKRGRDKGEINKTYRVVHQNYRDPDRMSTNTDI